MAAVPSESVPKKAIKAVDTKPRIVGVNSSGFESDEGEDMMEQHQTNEDNLTMIVTLPVQVHSTFHALIKIKYNAFE